MLLDTIVGPEVLDLVIKDQQYSTDYRFAIRVLSTKDDNVTDFHMHPNGMDMVMADSGQNGWALPLLIDMQLHSVSM